MNEQLNHNLIHSDDPLSTKHDAQALRVVKKQPALDTRQKFKRQALKPIKVMLNLPILFSFK